jgi:hypothetical protein
MNEHLQKLTSNPCPIVVKSGLSEMSNIASAPEFSDSENENKYTA